MHRSQLADSSCTLTEENTGALNLNTVGSEVQGIATWAYDRRRHPSGHQNADPSDRYGPIAVAVAGAHRVRFRVRMDVCAQAPERQLWATSRQSCISPGGTAGTSLSAGALNRSCRPPNDLSTSALAMSNLVRLR